MAKKREKIDGPGERDATFVFDPEAMKVLLASEDGPIAKNILKKCVMIERRAKELCPVDTGRLRNSISSELRTENDNLVGIVGTDVEYAPFVEFGTVRMDAQPFLIPAAYAVLQPGRGE